MIIGHLWSLGCFEAKAVFPQKHRVTLNSEMWFSNCHFRVMLCCSFFGEKIAAAAAAAVRRICIRNSYIKNLQYLLSMQMLNSISCDDEVGGYFNHILTLELWFCFIYPVNNRCGNFKLLRFHPRQVENELESNLK